MHNPFLKCGPRYGTRTVRSGFSLLEVAVVLGIVLILLAISIPVLRDMRSISRRSNCNQNLTRLTLALQAYAEEFNHFPVGTASYYANFQLLRFPVEEAATKPATGPNRETENNPAIAESESDDEVVLSLPKGYHHNWISAILPYMDRRGMYEAIDFDAGVYDPANRLIREADIAFLRCPSIEESQLPNTTSYAGIHASNEVAVGPRNNGLLMLDRWVVPGDVPDGLGYTMLLGEKISLPEFDLGWMSGTRSSLRNTGTPINAIVPTEAYRDPLFVGGLASNHAGGASISLGDGTIRFLSDSIDPEIFQDLASSY